MEGGRASTGCCFPKVRPNLFQMEKKNDLSQRHKKLEKQSHYFPKWSFIKKIFYFNQTNSYLFEMQRSLTSVNVGMRKENKREGLLTKPHSIIFTWKEAFKPTSQ